MVKGFVVYSSYIIVDGQAKVVFFGRLETGESFKLMKSYDPYFYIRTDDYDSVRRLNEFEEAKFEMTELKNFKGEKLTKIVLKIPKTVAEFRKILEKNNIPTYEADIRFSYRYMFDHDIFGFIEILGEFTEGKSVDRIYDEPEIRKTDFFYPPLKILSFDIETIGNQIVSFSLYGDSVAEVHVLSKNPVKNAFYYDDERSLLYAFRRRIKEIDPDIITGWNIWEFDFPFLRDRFRHYGINFEIGRNNEPVSVKVNRSFLKSSAVRVAGRVVIDGLDLVKSSFIKLDDYKLETAAREILGDRKISLEEYGSHKFLAIENVYKENIELFCEYNLKDSRLVLEILNEKKLFELLLHRSYLTGMPLDRVKASIASLDSLYIRKANKKGFVCPSAMPELYNDEKIKGGYVRDPLPGFYDYIIVFDFKSLYPSIIRTFNIDPITYRESGEIKAPNGACFTTEDGILPALIGELWKKREEAKKKGNFLEEQAIKLTMNSFFGVLANPTCRFYNLHIANAITSFGRKIVRDTATLVNNQGKMVIYGDTDSIFVKSDAKNYKEAKKIGRNIEMSVNKYYTKLVKEQYNRISYLQLEFEKVYRHFFMPRLRHTEGGAKKRYAGLVETDDGSVYLDFVGLEYVRRDWTDVSKLFQEKLLMMVFEGKNVDKFIRDFVRRLKSGEFDELLIYRKGLRKNIDSYTKTTPPHVKAARKMSRIDNSVISYVMTVAGPEPVSERRSSIDYNHYIERQIKPVAESILSLLNKDFDEILSNSSQTRLDMFFRK